MTKAYRISQVYDIATAFITSASSFVEITQKDNYIQYRFTQTLVNDGIYTLSITQPIGSAVKREPGVHEWEVVHKLGTIALEYKGENLIASQEADKKLMMLAQTRHSVGKAADKKSSDLEKLLARAKSRKFFKLIDMIKKRTCGNLPLQNNAKEIFNIIYRLKEMQK